MGNDDWYRIGTEPEFQPASDLQKKFLARRPEDVREILLPEERVNAELMGWDNWLNAVSKQEASRIIGVLKGGDVASEIRRRSNGGSDRKWYQTGLNDGGSKA